MHHQSKAQGARVSCPARLLTVAAVVLAAVSASAILGFAEDGPAATKTIAPEMNPVRQLALNARTMNHLKQLALAMHNYHDRNNHFPAAVSLGPDGKTPHSWRIDLLPYLEQQALYEEYRMNEPWDSENNKKVLEKMPEVFRSPFNDARSKNSGYYVLVGPGTVFEGPKGVSLQDISDGTSNTLMIVESKRDVPWTKPEDIPFNPNRAAPKLGGFVKGQFVGALADGSVRNFSGDGLEDELPKIIVRNDGQVVDLSRVGPIRRPTTTRTRVNTPGRPVGKASRTRNNLKQLAVAMQSYHDDHRHFPPAVVMGPDGKTPHSWRVELLPFLDAPKLYVQYDQNQPWDSEHNKKVLAQMPDVLRSPYDDAKSTNSGYYVLTGPGTIFEGPEGIAMSNITDGTSNTLFVVESKRNIPWTKPEDIAFYPDKPLPELGGYVDGGFNCTFADGSVRTLETARVKDQLKWLILRNDGHAIESQ